MQAAQARATTSASRAARYCAVNLKNERRAASGQRKNLSRTQVNAKFSLLNHIQYGLTKWSCQNQTFLLIAWNLYPPALQFFLSNIYMYLRCVKRLFDFMRANIVNVPKVSKEFCILYCDYNHSKCKQTIYFETKNSDKQTCFNINTIITNSLLYISELATQLAITLDACLALS